MSIEQYQRAVSSLDKDIADLEKKKAVSDGKAADARKKAANVSISKNASASTVKSKMKQIENYTNTAIKAEKESADLQKKIAEKRGKRNTAAQRLQKEEAAEKKKQDRATQQIMRSYESRIEELQNMTVSAAPITPTPTVGVEKDQDMPEYDVFVSHAWEDKGDFVDEFVDELRSLGIKVWYDTSEIKWGDSMRKRIDDGLRKSRFGVAVLSPNYIREGKYWTKAELDGLFQLDSIGGKVLLPIWHNLTKKEVMEYSPIIASKLAMNTASMTPKEIADELKKLLTDTEDESNG